MDFTEKKKEESLFDYWEGLEEFSLSRKVQTGSGLSPTSHSN